jgi:D-amino-acid oxidase
VVDAETKRWYEEGYKQWEVMSKGQQFQAAGVVVSLINALTS